MKITDLRHIVTVAAFHLAGASHQYLIRNHFDLPLGTHVLLRELGSLKRQGLVKGDPRDILRKTFALLKKAREKGFRYVPLAPAFNTEFPGVFVATADEEAFRNTVGRSKVAVIGTRNPSPYGVDQTRCIVDQYAEGFALVTPFALGISKIAIQEAIKKKMPVIAVSATGAGDIYPLAMKEIHGELMRTPGSAIVTPYFPEEAAIAINFLRRNQFVALADEVVVVESKEKGGAMVTAHLAEGFGNRVFAVPGRLDDKRSKGCNRLIAEGTARIFTD